MTTRDQEIITLLVEKMNATPRDGAFNDAGDLISLDLSGIGLSQIPPN